MFIWLRRLFKKPLPVRRQHGKPAGTFVHYSRVYPCAQRKLAVQETFVIDRNELRRSNYRLWLN